MGAIAGTVSDILIAPGHLGGVPERRQNPQATSWREAFAHFKMWFVYKPTPGI